MKIYRTIQDLINDCKPGEYGVSVIASPIYSEVDGELLGYKKEYV